MKNSRAIFLLLFANSVSGVAQGISMLAIPWYFAGIIHRETLFGKIYFVVTALSLFWGVYAGTLIDRYDRRKIFLVINIVGFAVLSAVTARGFQHKDLPWLLVALVFANTMFIYNIHFPNLYALAHEITTKENYSRVTSLLEIQGQLTFTIAGGCAAILLKGIEGHLNFFGFEIALPITIHAWKIYEIFAINTVTYVLAFLIIYRLRSLPVADKHIDKAPLQQRIKSGFTFLKKQPALSLFGNASLLVFMTVVVFGTYIQPEYVSTFLHQDGDVYAFSDMAFSFGAFLAGFLTTRVFKEKEAVRGIIILSAIAGVMYGVMFFNKILFLFIGSNFIIGACNAAIRIQRITYIFHHVPNHIIGRAGSIFFIVNVLFRLCAIGLFTLPLFHEYENIVYCVTGMALCCFGGAIILAINYRQIMHQPETA